MISKSTFNWVVLYSITIAVVLLNPSCKKDAENELNMNSSPSENSGNDNLNPDLAYGSVTDQDGNIYATIVIGDKEWMAENLRTSTYCNGDQIPNVTNGDDWVNLSSGAWVHFENSSQYENPYGKLYNWYTVDDARNICPCGWHVPTDAEWTELTDYLGGELVAGVKMKSTGTISAGTGLWADFESDFNEEATNESGFSGLPGGSRGAEGYYGLENSGFWWSSTESDPSNLAWCRSLHYYFGNIGRSGLDKGDNGFSVRCVKD